MRSRSLLVLWGAAALLAVGCPKKRAPERAVILADEPKAPSPSSSPARAPEEDPFPPMEHVSAPTPGLVKILPPVPKLELGMMDHATHFGWSSDSNLFGYCQPNGGRGDTQCMFHPRSGPTVSFGDWNSKTDSVDSAMTKALEARVTAMGVRATSDKWAHATDLEITWDTPGPGTLRVGARVRGQSPSWAIVLKDPSPYAHEGSIHPEVIAVSPDGLWLGAIAHTFHGEFSDAFFVGTASIARVAALAYNDAGYGYHKIENWSLAAVYFLRATDADPTFATSAYNLACAYARLGDKHVKAALTEAILRAGADAPRMKADARKDKDLSSVASAAWFIALTT